MSGCHTKRGRYGGRPQNGAATFLKPLSRGWKSAGPVHSAACVRRLHQQLWLWRRTRSSFRELFVLLSTATMSLLVACACQFALPCRHCLVNGSLHSGRRPKPGSRWLCEHSGSEISRSATIFESPGEWTFGSRNTDPGRSWRAVIASRCASPSSSSLCSLLHRGFIILTGNTAIIIVWPSWLSAKTDHLQGIPTLSIYIVCSKILIFSYSVTNYNTKLTIEFCYGTVPSEPYSLYFTACFLGTRLSTNHRC